jgi:hypothetical protein
MMVKRFRSVWKPDWTERARSLNFTPRQIVTTASIIETEAKLDEERPIVASVIYNRLKRTFRSRWTRVSSMRRSLKESGATTERFTRATSKTLALQHSNLCGAATGTSRLTRREFVESGALNPATVGLSLLRSQSGSRRRRAQLLQ